MPEGSAAKISFIGQPQAHRSTITAGFIEQASTIMRLPPALQKRKELFLKLAEMADAIEAATQRGA